MSFSSRLQAVIRKFSAAKPRSGEDLSEQELRQLLTRQGDEPRDAYLRRVDKQIPKAKSIRPTDSGAIESIRQTLKAVVPGAAIAKMKSKQGGFSIRPVHPKKEFSVEERALIEGELRKLGAVTGVDGRHFVPAESSSYPTSDIFVSGFDADGPLKAFTAKAGLHGKHLWEVPRSEYEELMSTVVPDWDRFAQAEVFDWGPNNYRGAKRGGLMRGGMTQAPEGKRMYVDFVSKLPEAEKEDANSLLATGHEYQKYATARTAGFNHDSAILAALGGQDLDAHQASVEAALSKGASVSDTVLADYPELAARYNKQIDWSKM